MEESGGRPRYPKQEGRERGPVADEAETWRNQDAARGYSPKSERRGQGKRGGLHHASSKKGAMEPLSSYPAGGFKEGHSPSQREDFQRARYPENQQAEGREENWRERPSQRFRRTSQGEDREQRRDNVDNTLHSGGRNRRNHNWRRGLGEEDHGPVVDESALSAKELLGLKQAEDKIGREKIFRLKKRSHSNPSAVYTCSLCEVLLDSVSDAHRHIKDKWHKRRAKERCEEEMLTEIVPPRAEQVAAVGVALEGVVRERGMSDQDVENRQQIVSNMQEVLTAVLPEVKLRLYGSSCTKFGFKDSDVNIDIQFPPHMHQPDVLLLVQKSLSVSLLYGNLEADFHARVPVVICKDKNSGLVCKVSAGNDNACLTTSFLFELSNREPLLLPLVLGFRHWARICHVDRAEEGGLPSYVLALMVVYFLQQRKRPVLPAYLGHEIKEFSISRLHDFSLTYMEDGWVHWGYHPVSKDSSSSPPETIYREGKAPLVFQSSVSPPAVGLLWVEMLRFYSLEFNMAECVISVRTSLVLSRDAKDWPKKRIAVEESSETDSGESGCNEGGKGDTQREEALKPAGREASQDMTYWHNWWNQLTDFQKQVILLMSFVDDFWSSLTEGQQMATGIIAVNAVVLCCWRIPSMQRSMVKYFTANPASKTRCLPMLLSTFSHYSIIHMAANMYVLWTFSSSIVSLLGKEQFLAVYLSAGVISTMVSYVCKTSTGRLHPSLGASGAIMTVLAAVCTKMPEAKLGIILLPMVSFTAGNALKAIVAMDAAGLIMGWRLFDHAAHLGGALFGVWYVAYGHKLMWRKREPLVKAWHSMRSQAPGGRGRPGGSGSDGGRPGPV